MFLVIVIHYGSELGDVEFNTIIIFMTKPLNKQPNRERSNYFNVEQSAKFPNTQRVSSSLPLRTHYRPASPNYSSLPKIFSAPLLFSVPPSAGVKKHRAKRGILYRIDIAHGAGIGLDEDGTQVFI